MDSLSALGLVSNIVQFIDFCEKSVSSIRARPPGLNAAAAEVQAELADSLRNYAFQLELQLLRSGPIVDDRIGPIAELTKECKDLCLAIVKVLQNDADLGRKSKLRLALRDTFRDKSHQRELDEIGGRLRKVKTVLTVMLETWINEAQSTTNQQSEALQSSVVAPRLVRSLTLHEAAEKGLRVIVEVLLELPQLQVNEQDPDGRTALHLAAKNGHADIVRLLLKYKAKVDDTDREGRTPLYLAVAGRHKDVISILLANDADVNRVDKVGKTILATAIGEDECLDIIEMLLEKTASPIFRCPENVISLISAAAGGHEGEVRRLLDQDIIVDSPDGFGYTALYEASRFGHTGIVKLLIDAGAKINAKVGLGGDTALHAVVDRGQKYAALLRKLGDNVRQEIPSLGRQHEAVTEKLLQCGADPNLKRWDGLTVQDMAAKIMDGLSPNDVQRGPLRAFLVKLENPPPVELTAPRNWKSSPPSLDADMMKICDHFKARIQYHIGASGRQRDTRKALSYRMAPVGSLIYGQEEGNSERAKITELENWAKEGVGEPGRRDLHYWRWVHLPSNNKLWVKHVIRRLHQSVVLSTDPRQLEAFIDDSYDEFRGSAPHARYRRPGFSKLVGNTGDVWSLVIPFFDMETEMFLDRKNYIKEDTHCAMKQELENFYRRGGEDVEDLHLSCTLDQTYYMSINDTVDIRDQVVYRYTNNLVLAAANKSASPKSSSNGGALSEPKDTTTVQIAQDEISPKSLRRAKIVMVNQLWLWKVDSNTIITAFPDRWHQGQEDDLLTYLSRMFLKHPPYSMQSMIKWILCNCTAFIDAPCNAGLDENCFEIFEQSIATVSSRQTARYRSFYSLIKSGYVREQSDNTADNAYAREIRDITVEVECLKEIKDIRDELKMIQRVLEDQRRVITSYCQKTRENVDDDKWSLLTYRVRKAEWLVKEAEAVEASVSNRLFANDHAGPALKTDVYKLNHLLDLKQKQGNLDEATDTRRLAKLADERARAGETQSQLLFIFTVVTVIFTPLSFTSGFFAIPSHDFPQINGGGGINWRWWQIFVALLVTEAVTLVVIFFFWLRRDDVQQSSTASLQATKPLPIGQSSNLQAVPRTNSSLLGDGSKKAVARPALREKVLSKPPPTASTPSPQINKTPTRPVSSPEDNV
ncbi:hypothetical protein AYL99_10620 [Fonsecaea erecta]|uniref:Uncharacterized protein n=1 Tax=Fonsecaea erecta TaxID=1367422 RepID=A0A178Z577_9EURO|nr:hypothetical protein AYL99_10620 [Fonsecaea erecta]OAP54920.1 hypothetical protein AYL99_10620 [Fonsecaea erecta]